MIPSDAWRERALCAGMADETFADEEVDPFYHPGVPLGKPPGKKKPPKYVAAVAICAHCPVRTECLDDAMRTEPDVWQRYGVRGGLTPAERKALAKQRVAS